jgi:CBS domain containing-hemolysin-like protein
MVQRRAVFDQLMHGERTKRLRDLMRPALFVPENLRGHQLLELLIAQRQHLAIVTDTAGRTSGVVSLEDVLEYLLGRPIIGEHDAHPEMERMTRERTQFHASAAQDGLKSENEG